MAVDKKVVDEQIGALCGFGKWFTKKERNCLHEVMSPGERICAMTSGLLDGNTWLVTVTDKRILFLDKGMISGLKQIELPLSNINAVSHKTDVLFGKIEISTASGTKLIDLIEKADVEKIAQIISDLINKSKGAVHSATVDSQGLIASFTFNCPNCTQKLEAENEWIGQAIQCPQCAKSIIIPDLALHSTSPSVSVNLEQIHPPTPDTPAPPQSPQLTTEVSPAGEQIFRTSPDSPDGAIDKQLLATFLTDLQLAADEELFFFLKTLVPAMDLDGFIKPVYNLMVSSRRVLAIAKDKAGKISRSEFMFEKIKSVEVADTRLLMLKALKIVVTDPSEHLVEYRVSNNVAYNKKDHLPAVVEYIKKCKAIEESSPTLNAIEKLQFRKFISEQSGMDIKDVDSYIQPLTEAERNKLMISFKKRNTIATPGGGTSQAINMINDNNAPPQCPRCKSTQTTCNKQGVSAGKELVGAMLTGGFSIFAGGIGKNKIIMTCLKCGYQWKVNYSPIHRAINKLLQP